MTDANAIEQQMSALSDRLDRVGVGANRDTIARINGLLADWQDFYWSNYEQWPVNQLEVWANNLPNMQAALTALEQQAGTSSAPITTQPRGPVIEQGAINVTGTWPTWMKVTAGSILALVVYKAAKKVL